MKSPVTTFVCLAALTLGLGSNAAEPELAYPSTRTSDTVETIHGIAVHDPYRWLENAADSEVQKWTQQQNALTRQTLDAFAAERAQLTTRLAELNAGGRTSSPVVRDDQYLYAKRTGDQNHAALYLRSGSLNADPTVALDPNTFSTDGTVALDWWHPAPDGKLILYGQSAGGSEKSTLYLHDAANNATLSLRIPNTRACTVAWEPGYRGFYYTRYPEPGSVPAGDENYYRRVYYHKLGTDWPADPLVFGEGRSKTEWPVVYASGDDRYVLLIAEQGWTRNDLFLAEMGATEFKPVVTGRDALCEDADVLGDTLYLRTNLDAPRYRIVAVDVAHPEPENWRTIIPEGPNTIEQLRIVGGKLVLSTMEDASSRLAIHDTDGTLLKQIELPTLGTVAGLSGRQDGHELFFQFESFVYAPTVFRYDLTDDQLTVFDRSGVQFAWDDYVTEQVWFNSKDGTRVPMFVVHRRDFERNGQAPTILYAYGGFNISLTPYFQERRLPWLERGGIYAIANLRGGGEFGEDWHRAGMLGNKQHVFDDFIAAAEKLIADGYTSSAKLAIRGGSNGGLLIGAAVVQRPDLFKAANSAVPLLDMVRYQNFSIAKLWIPEYGDPADAEQFRWLYAYSPYHHVEKGVKYPAVLFTTADSDSRVDPMHARKMAAAMQAATASDNPVLLWVETQAGHGAGKPVSKRIDEDVDFLTFFMWQLGMTAG